MKSSLSFDFDECGTRQTHRLTEIVSLLHVCASDVVKPRFDGPTIGSGT